MRHTYECQLRWADMDLLGHVNNVTYLEYLAQARHDLLGDHPAGRARVARHQVRFVSPLVFRRRPVLVDTWVSAAGESTTLEHEVYDDRGGERTTYLLATTVLDHRLDEGEAEVVAGIRGDAQEWRPIERGAALPRTTYDLAVRVSDLAPDGAARDVVHLEYFQEARIRYLMDLHTRGEQWSHHVVATTDVELLAPVRLRRAPYAVRSWIGHLGTRSFTIASELVDGEEVLARAGVVMVTFDRETQGPTEMAAQQRETLAAELAGAQRG